MLDFSYLDGEVRARGELPCVIRQSPRASLIREGRARVPGTVLGWDALLNRGTQFHGLCAELVRWLPTDMTPM